MNQQYRNINAEIDAMYAQLDAVCADEEYDAQAYDQVSEALAKLQDERDEMLAGILMERYNTGARQPITFERALELALHANEQRDNRARGVEVEDVRI